MNYIGLLIVIWVVIVVVAILAKVATFAFWPSIHAPELPRYSDPVLEKYYNDHPMDHNKLALDEWDKTIGARQLELEYTHVMHALKAGDTMIRKVTDEVDTHPNRFFVGLATVITVSIILDSLLGRRK